MEGIPASIDKEIIYFCGYENMLKFYMTGIVDLHKDKKEKFVSLCKNANIIAHFNCDLLDKLRNKISQRKLSNFLGCSQACISKSYKKRHLSVANLSRILNYIAIDKESLCGYITYLTVSNTKVTNKESIKFLIYNKLSV